MFIYKITNRHDGKFYVGQTVNAITYRFRKHCEQARRGEGYKLHAAIRKHGVDNFTVELLEECESLEHLNEREEHLISTLKPAYNLCPGGAFRLGPESIAKMAESLRGNKQSDETVTRRFTALRELEKSPEFRAKRGKAISEAKLKEWVVEGVSYRGLEQLGKAYGISAGAAAVRIRRGYDKWGPPH